MNVRADRFPLMDSMRAIAFLAVFVTLFLPNDGEESFAAITDGPSLRALFARRFADAIPLVVWYLDDPVADPALVPLYFIAREARTHDMTCGSVVTSWVALNIRGAPTSSAVAEPPARLTRPEGPGEGETCACRPAVASWRRRSSWWRCSRPPVCG